MAVMRPFIRVTLATLSCLVLAVIVLTRLLPIQKPTTQKGALPEPLDLLPLTKVERTMVVPTLDTPLNDGQSAIWCAAFQLAWDRLKADVTKGPVHLRNAEAVAQRLNEGQVSEADLRPEDYFATAGLAGDRFVETIQREMARRFPNAPPLEFELPRQGLAAFAFLAAGVPWRYEFHDNHWPLTFTNADGLRTPVRSFGILEKDEDARGESFRGQVVLLWASDGEERTPEQFAVDLCRHSTPYQVVLARMSRKSTLADTLKELQRKMQRNQPKKDRLGEEDTLLVPTMHWRIKHHFEELEGPDKVVTSGPCAGLFMSTAVQSVQFRLDRRGAELASGALSALVNGGPRRLHFDRPFLLYLKKRDAKQPILVMWVENAELMQPF